HLVGWERCVYDPAPSQPSRHSPPHELPCVPRRIAACAVGSMSSDGDFSGAACLKCRVTAFLHPGLSSQGGSVPILHKRTTSTVNSQEHPHVHRRRFPDSKVDS